MLRMRVVVLRIGHRYVRDYRVTMHVALVARAFGASRMLLASDDKSIVDGIMKVNERWGGGFEVECIGSEQERWLHAISEWKKSGIVVHLTMYGLHVDDVIGELRRRCHTEGRDVMVVVGAEKVPRVVYEVSDYNIAIGNQPHSEVAALAILLDRIFEGRELRAEFKGRMRIVPDARGKRVVTSEGDGDESTGDTLYA
ncbi:MAG: tRNA (cytidine(56)-2'-O)-methyltransferase [Candidatus Nitrosocaldus sp.]|nr:tRNA (cytidine(56)-2'-O)-methyltransferase [Candidatus Nitrosocaldus sp.]MDW8274894.1 tRNA (cytidine(56)-2'-O)-methyltransferase [Candidatus Nitrosocaldus sp.]